MTTIEEVIERQKAEVHANYEVFKQQLPELMKGKHRGKHALMHNGEIVGFFKSREDAFAAAEKKLAGKHFSVQEVDDTPIELGILSLL